MHSQNKEVSKVHDGRSLPKRERFITLLASAGKNWTSQAAFCLPMKPKVATEKEESDLVKKPGVDFFPVPIGPAFCLNMTAKLFSIIRMVKVARI